MKSLLTVLLAAGALSLSAQTPIKGTKHDLSSTGPQGKTNTTQTCVFCHAPHNNNAAALGPLWNRNTVAHTFTMYTSNTIKGNVGTIGGASAACFTCHDGTTSVGSVVNVPKDAVGGLTYNTAAAGTRMSATGVLTGTAVLGTNLTGDHPVAITYVAANTGLVNPTAFVAGTVKLFGASGNAYGSTVECASCHDVHGGVAGTPFLRMSNAGSALCTACHIK
jgi:predicted CXXCH cytochrome family protein